MQNKKVSCKVNQEQQDIIKSNVERLGYASLTAFMIDTLTNCRAKKQKTIKVAKKVTVKKEVKAAPITEVAFAVKKAPKKAAKKVAKKAVKKVK